MLMDAALCQAVDEMLKGLIDADLGGNVLKKRVAMPGRGKSAGARTLAATRKAGRWFFVFGSEKNERTGVSPTELEALQEQARAFEGRCISGARVQVDPHQRVDPCESVDG